jgi:tetratricopeptide (TPR) repeat protein
MPPTPPPFTPPSPEQVRDLLDEHPVRPSSPLVMAAPWAVLLLAAVLAVVVRHPALAMLPWLALAGVFGWFIWRAASLRRLDREARQVQEAAALLHWVKALRAAWRLLPRLTATPPLYGSTVVVIADCLDRLRCYEAAVVAYDHLIDRLPDDGPDAALMRIHRAIAELQSDQLLDADDTLRRLRGPIEAGQYPQPLPAFYRLAVLLQQVHTHHYTEAVEGSRRMLRDLRPLGASAGFGHALLALAFHMLDGQPGHPDARRYARAWWGRATLLVPPGALIHRFPALQTLTTAYDR